MRRLLHLLTAALLGVALAAAPGCGDDNGGGSGGGDTDASNAPVNTQVPEQDDSIAPNESKRGTDEGE